MRTTYGNENLPHKSMVLVLDVLVSISFMITPSHTAYIFLAVHVCAGHRASRRRSRSVPTVTPRPVSLALPRRRLDPRTHRLPPAAG